MWLKVPRCYTKYILSIHLKCYTIDRPNVLGFNELFTLGRFFVLSKLTHYLIFSISSDSQSSSLTVYTFSVTSWISWPTIYLIAYSSTLYFLAFVTKCIRPSCALWSGFNPSLSLILSWRYLYFSYVSLKLLRCVLVSVQLR